MKKLIVGLKNKYQSVSAPVKASFWFLFCGFLQKGISMLTTPIFTRIMTEKAYGQSSLYNSWYNIIFIIVSFELAAGVYTRGLIKNKEKADAFSSSLLFLSTVSVIIYTGIYLVFHNALNKLTGLSTYMMVMMIIEMWSTIAYQFWSNRERVAYRYKKLVALMITFTLLRPIAGVIAVLSVSEQYQFEARITATTLVNLVLFFGLYVSIMKKGRMTFNKEYWKYALSFNLPLIPHYLSQVILNQSDRIMIGKYCDSAAVGYYSVAYSLAMVMQIFNSSVSATMNPWIYRSIKNENYKRIEQISYTILAVIAGLNFVMVALGPELLKIMAPGSYYAAVWVIPPVTVSVYFMFLYNLFATFEYYYNKTRWVMYASVIGAAANIVLNAIFIPRFGFVAAGYTTLVCYVLYAFMHYLFMKKACGIYLNGRRIYKLRIIMLIGLLLIIGSACMLLLYRHMLIRYAVLVALAIAAFFLKDKIIGAFKELKEK